MAALQALLGHQYGAACLPSHVEASEFQLLLQESQQAGISTLELERVYGRDENATPPSYWLRHGCRPQVVTLGSVFMNEWLLID